MRRIAAFIVLSLACLSMTGCMIVQARTDGRLAYKQGRYQDAIDSYRTLFENERAEDIEMQTRMGQSYLKLGNLKKARFHLEQAVELAFINPQEEIEYGDEAMDDLAETLYLQKDTPRLSEALDRMKNRMGRVKDYTRKGVYLQKVGDLDNALVALKQGVRLNIQRLVHAERTEDELAVVRLDLSEVDVSSFMALADLYSQINQKDKAIMTLRNAYYYNPDAPGLKQALAGLGVVPGKDTGVKPDPHAIP